MRTVSLFLVSSFVVTALSAGTALAERKTYPGAWCQTSGSARSAVKLDDVGRAFNDSNGTTQFVCPFDTRTEFLKSAKIYVNDARTNAQVLCTLSSQDSQGDVRHAVQRGSGNLDAGRSIQLAFTTGLDVTVNGFVVLTCDVPGKSTEGNLSGLNTYLGHED